MKSNIEYTNSLRAHYEQFFSVNGTVKKWTKGPTEKLSDDFYILEIPPNSVRNLWIYCTVGMSSEAIEYPIELFIYSPQQHESICELLVMTASYHRNVLPLNLHYTVNIGRPWFESSQCDHAFISSPYLEGTRMEIFSLNDKIIYCYWLIPITREERDYKIEHGWDALEQLFEAKSLDYSNPNRRAVVK